VSDTNKPEAEQPVKAKTLPPWLPVLPKDFTPSKEAPPLNVVRHHREPIDAKFSLEQAFASFDPLHEADHVTRQLWGISESLTDGGSLPPGVFTFAEAVKQSWCQNKDGRKRTVYGLKRLLSSIGIYPPVLFERQLISEAGFNRALELQRERDRQRDTEAAQRRRAAERRSRPRRRSSS
jgi:hypothetical protein